MTKRKDPKDYLKRGKPLKVFTTEEKKIIQEVLDAISMGQSLVKLAEKNGIPEITLYDWLNKPEYAEKYAQAKTNRGHKVVQNIQERYIELREGKIDPITARVLIDTDKWLASKFYPKMFGDKVQVGGDSEQPLTIVVDTGIRRK